MTRRTPRALKRERETAEAAGLSGALVRLNRNVTEAKLRKGTRPKAATRADKKGLVIYVDPAVSKAIRLLALQLDQTVHRLGLEAIRLLLDRHNVAMPDALLTTRLLPVEAPPPAIPSGTRGMPASGRPLPALR